MQDRATYILGPTCADTWLVLPLDCVLLKLLALAYMVCRPSLCTQFAGVATTLASLLVEAEVMAALGLEFGSAQ